MKKIIIFIFILSTFVSFSQENEFNKKHNLLWDIGINHTSNFKPEYHPAYKPPNHLYYPQLETLYPGNYSLPVFNYQTNFQYRFYFYRGFNINARFNISYWKEIKTRSTDSINKYYLYSDSVINILPYEFLGSPIYSKSNEFILGFNLSFGYRYKRFLISTGIQYPLFEFRKYFTEYKNNKQRSDIIKSNILFNNFDYDLNTRIEYIVINKKVPLSIYLEVNNAIFGGIVINTSYIKFNQ